MHTDEKKVTTENANLHMHIPENTNTHAHGNIGKGKNSIVVYPLHVMYVRVSRSRGDTSAGKNRRVQKDGKGTRKGITYQQEFLAEKKRREQRNSVTTHRVYEKENMGWREANNAFQ